MDRPQPSSLSHYGAHAADYAAALAEHDTGDARARFLAALPARAAAPGADILDLGCGPGRDLGAFRAAGHRAVGLEGCAALAAVARRNSGAEVWERDLFSPRLPPSGFDGVWVQAVLFHVPTAALRDLLSQLWACLRPGGILYACDPTGADEEGWVADRYLSFRRPQTFKKKAREAGFDLVAEWRRPPGVPRHRQTWLATLWRRGL